METKSNKWYDKTAIVVLLLVVFFPIGLYGLWKSNSISKGWKIGISSIFILLIIASFSNNNSSVATSNSTVENKYEVSGSQCYIISQNFIKLLLKSPKSADFPAMEFKHSQVDSVTHIVSSYVDAVNSFNAPIRTYYTITMKFNGGEWSDQSNWSVVDVKTR